ncbi:Endoribonuclease L-PSP/chorismate mutase-like protein [Triangularia verruculosa]|uniref:Endoribonuclease L-PSP/chorismate mutase-like protein n=1 Tax=Triangularia verruculosa TaxID=2587418 RepID=A0AAN7AUY5_9PEZI|nr:Endoribonuclease L-PSP/chorismate mutase-like protein [Triangularia verruculosa]
MGGSTPSLKPMFFTYPGHGEILSKEFHYSQAVRIGNRIEISGEGGWNPTTGAISSSLAEEIEHAFSNVELALQAASPDPTTKVTWRQSVAATLKRFCGPEHRPILTVVGVPQLALPGMNTEIEVVALVDLNN